MLLLQQKEHQQQRVKDEEEEKQGRQPRQKREPIGPNRQVVEQPPQSWGQGWQHEGQDQAWQESSEKWKQPAPQWEAPQHQWHEQQWQHSPQQWQQAEHAEQPQQRPRRQRGKFQQGAGGEAAAALPADATAPAAAICGTCHRGKPLKLYADATDGQSYCRKCWIAHYGEEPW